MTTARRLEIEQMHDLIEATIRARRQMKATELCATMPLSLDGMCRRLRALAADGRVHRVRTMSTKGTRGGIWAPGPAPLDRSGDKAIVEPTQMHTKSWPAPKVRFTQLEMCLFGRAPVEARV